jgi:hypothetical protein
LGKGRDGYLFLLLKVELRVVALRELLELNEEVSQVQLERVDVLVEIKQTDHERTYVLPVCGREDERTNTRTNDEYTEHIAPHAVQRLEEEVGAHTCSRWGRR